MPIALRSGLAAEIAWLAVLAGWIGFFAILAVGKRGAAPGAAKRDWKSSVGFLLQVVAYAICFVFPRMYFWPLSSASRAGRLGAGILSAVTVTTVVASVWLCYAAARALGKQWALVARIIEGHELVATGPYAIVRNPIYLSMLGMFVAEALAFARWQAGLAGLVVFVLGAAIRIRTEENLLRAKFGGRFDEYARRVPALFPRVFRSA